MDTAAWQRKVAGGASAAWRRMGRRRSAPEALLPDHQKLHAHGAAAEQGGRQRPGALVAQQQPGHKAGADEQAAPLNLSAVRAHKGKAVAAESCLCHNILKLQIEVHACGTGLHMHAGRRVHERWGGGGRRSA